jgi:hypothetical protein
VAGFLSPWPFGFRHAHQIISWTSSHPGTFELSNHGLRICLPCIRNYTNVANLDAIEGPLDVALDCRYENKPWTQITLTLDVRPSVAAFHQSIRPTNDYTICERGFNLPDSDSRLSCVPFWTAGSCERVTLTLARELFTTRYPGLGVHITFPTDDGFFITSDPPCAWHSQSATLTLPPSERHDLAPRAAILITPTDLAEMKSVLVLITELPGTFVARRDNQMFLRVGAVPWSRFTSLRDGFFNLEAVPPWTHRHLNVTGQKTLEVSMKLVVAADETLWHLHLCEWPQVELPSRGTHAVSQRGSLIQFLNAQAAWDELFNYNKQ